MNGDGLRMVKCKDRVWWKYMKSKDIKVYIKTIVIKETNCESTQESLDMTLKKISQMKLGPTQDLFGSTPSLK